MVEGDTTTVAVAGSAGTQEDSAVSPSGGSEQSLMDNETDQNTRDNVEDEALQLGTMGKNGAGGQPQGDLADGNNDGEHARDSCDG